MPRRRGKREEAEEPESNHQIQPGYTENGQAGVKRDSRTFLNRPYILGRERRRQGKRFPVQRIASRIVNHAQFKKK